MKKILSAAALEDPGILYTGLTSSSTRWPKLLVYSEHWKKQADELRPRHNCEGNLVWKQIDTCAFNGPLARVVFGPKREGKFPYIDIYVYYRGVNISTADDCVFYENEWFCVFIPSTACMPLPPTTRVGCGPVTSSVLSASDEILQAFYGEDWQTPPFFWNGTWSQNPV